MELAQIFLQFNLLSLLLLLIVTTIHLRFNYAGSLSRRLMSLFLFSVFYATFVPYLINTRLILHVPHLYRTGTFGGLITAPLVYLITLSALEGRRLKWSDLLHLLPLAFYIVNFFPVFMLSGPEKVTLISAQSISSTLYSYSEGWLVSGSVMGDIRVIQILVYLVITIRKVAFRKMEQEQWKDDDLNLRPVILQLLLFILLYILPYLVAFGKWFNIPLGDTNQVSFALANLVLVIFFLTNPELLYGFRVVRPAAEGLVVEEQPADNLIPVVEEEALAAPTTEQAKERVRRRIERISKHLAETQAFLSPEFGLATLEKDLGISGKLISQTIKEGTGFNFSSYINEMRIAYVIDRLQNDPMWKNYTVETLASTVGYRSPTSFYNNFRESTGKTPREFIESLG